MIFYSETPLATLMRIEKMTRFEAQRDFKKRQVILQISFTEETRKWILRLFKNEKLIFEKGFSKSCHADILEWFLAYDLDRDECLSIKVPWKQIERGVPWKALVYINRRLWKKLELPTEWQLCEIYHWRPRPGVPRPNGFGLLNQTGVVIPMRGR